METKIRYKFNRAVGIPGPKGELLSPKIHNDTIRNPITGAPNEAAVQRYNYDEEYEVDLLEEEKELPEHIADLGPEVRTAFVQNFAKELAENHAANEAFRKSLKYYEKEGHITVLSDTFKDKKKESLNAKVTTKKAEKGEKPLPASTPS